METTRLEHNPEDFKVLQYISEHTSVTSNYGSFEEDNNKLGDNGLYIPILGVDLKTSFQSLVEHWCGTEELTYALYDFPGVVEECLEVMQQNDKKTVEISANSSAEAFIFWEDSSTTNISPDFFLKYTAPQIAQWSDILHAQNKLLIHHACGHIKDLLPLMTDTKVDMIESISPPPTGNIELADAFKILPPNIGLIGGIEPTVLLNSTLDELECYVKSLISQMKGRRFILANSDSCPPNVEYEKFLMVTRVVLGM